MQTNIAYFGTSTSSADLLDVLCAEELKTRYRITLVVTRSDKPVGRKKIITPSPVKFVAQKRGLIVCEDLEKATLLIKEHHIDLGLLFSYGKIVRKDILSVPRFGFWNAHPSLLPQYRGASPVPYAIMMGETSSGVTIMQMDEKLDHGPIIAQEHFTIDPHEKANEVLNRVVPITHGLITKLFKENPQSWPRAPQEHGFATYTKLLTREHGYIEPTLLKNALMGNIVQKYDFPTIFRDYTDTYHQTITSLPAVQVVYNIYRALFPWPGIWTYITTGEEKKRCKLTKISSSQDKLHIDLIHIEGGIEQHMNNKTSFQDCLFAV